jgi:hypothetical protein
MSAAILHHFQNVTKTEISENEVREFTRESDFVGKCVDLLIEAGSYLVCASSIYPRPEGWNRSEAIIGGSLIRMTKLLDAILDQTCRHRLETSFILSRLLFETCVNTAYLMADPKEEQFTSFIAYSLQNEGKLLSRIEENVASRNGEILPIEERMLRSIQKTFDESGFQREDLPAKRMRDWSPLSIRDRADLLGLVDWYDTIYANGSQIVHGNWSDLYQHHLVREGIYFRSKPSFKAPRPQFLEANAIVSVHLVSCYIDFLGLFTIRDSLSNLLEDFVTRVRKLSNLHEDFLNKQA